MFMVASSNQLEEETREAAIEVLVTLTEAKPVMMKYFFYSSTIRKSNIIHFAFSLSSGDLPDLS